jgi:UDPglucose 6-dehydrogenase
MKAALKFPIIIDGRNLYAPTRMAESGFTYVSVGRPDAAPHKSAVKAPRA